LYIDARLLLMWVALFDCVRDTCVLQALESKLATCRAIDRSQLSSFHECTSPTQSTPK